MRKIGGLSYYQKEEFYTDNVEILINCIKNVITKLTMAIRAGDLEANYK